jgi:MFS family permease
MPTAILIRKMGARIFLPGITLLWGIVMICCGFVHDWKDLNGLRIITGTFEAGLFPGAIFLLSMWYSRYDLYKRYSSFYLFSIVGSSLSGILAFCFIQMAGLAHYEGWRWIFIMEGILTCLISFIGFVCLVDFPQEAHKNSWHFLSEDEAAYLIRRINRDRKDAENEPFILKKFLKPARDVKIWGFGFLFL